MKSINQSAKSDISKKKIHHTPITISVDPTPNFASSNTSPESINQLNAQT